jgi:arylsulfatase A-like enzyme
MLSLILASSLAAWVPHDVRRVRNVVIVTLDTTRADYLAAYGSSRAGTPALDRLAREGIVFERAITVAPLTLTAHTSLMTGLLPPRHGVRDNASPPLSPEHGTLAQLLHARGMRTGAFVGAAVLAADRGLSSGFDTYTDGLSPGRCPTREVRRSGAHVVDDALDWLEQQTTAPFFAWIHLYDAHAPYRLEEPYRTLYAEDPYAGEIAFADAQIERVIETLERRKVLDTTAIVVAADHGESLGEHGEVGHGLHLYETVLQVPLVIRVPGLAPRRVSPVVSLVDVMPTILDLVHANAPIADGVSLMPEMLGSSTRAHDAYSESFYPIRLGLAPLRSLRDGRFKVIDGAAPELYDLEQDPLEEHNLRYERRSLAVAMSRQLARTFDATSSHAEAERASLEVMNRLAALGYVMSEPGK